MVILPGSPLHATGPASPIGRYGDDLTQAMRGRGGGRQGAAAGPPDDGPPDDGPPDDGPPDDGPPAAKNAAATLLGTHICQASSTSSRISGSSMALSLTCTQ